MQRTRPSPFAVAFAAVALLFCGATALGAPVPYRGYLEKDGAPVNGARTLIFRIFDSEAEGATLVWEEAHPDVAIVGGRFSVLLGATVALAPRHLTGDGYLEVSVQEGTQDPVRLGGRQRLGAAPFAKQAEFPSDLPIGTILAYGGTSLPPGFLWCDGASVERTAYPELFAVIGTAFGAPDAAHFNVPDFRGRFLRGQDQGAGLDPDAATRTAMKPGGATGDAVGSVQGHMFARHNHDYGDFKKLLKAGSNDVVATQPAPEWFNWWARIAGGNYMAEAAEINPAGGAETRPVNASVRFIIKAKRW